MTADTLRAPESETAAIGGGWATILWDDPVSLQGFVVRVLMRRLGHSRERATALMHQAEREGRAAVAHGSREAQEMHVAALHAEGLVATLEPVPGAAA
jgi:ATP-dependent Clp protease adaptor protein ClpS